MDYLNKGKLISITEIVVLCLEKLDQIFEFITSFSQKQLGAKTKVLC